MNDFNSIKSTNNVIKDLSKKEDWSAVLQKLTIASDAFNEWKQTNVDQRSQLLNNVAQILDKNTADFGQMITKEMGKPLHQSIAEVKKCALVCRYYAQNSANFLQDINIDTGFKKSYVSYQPLGCILQIMPFNFPFWQVFRFAAPALMAGNVSLLKHAPSVPGCVKLIQSVFMEAGFKPGVFQHVDIDLNLIEKIIAHPVVQGVALTGSTQAGMAVGAISGKNIKTCVLELGGSDPFIVLADADLEAAATVAVQSRMHNSGQTCISAKRFILEKTIAPEFKRLVKEKIGNLVVGDPYDPSTNISALARLDLAQKLQKQVDRSVELGAVVELPGGHQQGSNYFYPMMLSNLKKGMPAYEEELFGPVVCVFEVNNAQEALQLSNSSSFGLAATVWTKNEQLAQSIAKDLEVGAVAINRLMSSDPRIPFGGVKKSGIGRELGKEGLLSFVNIKSIIIA
jgi:succinate-semialdehyde dehydrogenase/glutarate-semialdehyde dehydrogenase